MNRYTIKISEEQRQILLRSLRCYDCPVLHVKAAAYLITDLRNLPSDAEHNPGETITFIDEK